MADDEDGNYRLTDTGRRLVEAGLFHLHYERVKDAEKFAHFFGPLFEPIATTTTTTTEKTSESKLHRLIDKPGVCQAFTEFLKAHDKEKEAEMKAELEKFKTDLANAPKGFRGIAPNMSSRYNVEEFCEQVSTTTTTTTTTVDESTAVATNSDSDDDVPELVPMTEEDKANEGSMNFATVPLDALHKHDWKEYYTMRLQLRDDYGINLPMRGWVCSECHVMFIEPTTWCAHEWRPREILDF
jgi:hypothetical protein